MEKRTFLEKLGIIARAEATDSTSLADGYADAITSSMIPSRAAAHTEPRGLDAVYRALFILETAARQLTLDVWRGRTLIDTPSLVSSPNLDMSQGAFIAETVSSLAQRGNAFWKITREPGGSIINLEVLNPLEVACYRDQKGNKVIEHLGRRLRRNDVHHLRLTHVPGEVLGISPIQACRATIDGALDMRSYADNWTKASGRPTGILSTDQKLTSEQADEWKARANTLFTPENGVTVLSNGLSYQKLLLNPEELQFLESQQANVVAVARMFGVPARHMLAVIEGGSQTYSNLEQEEIAFIRYTLMAYLREIEEAFTALTVRGQTVRFNLEGLLRTDTKTRYEGYQIGINANFLTPDEVREFEGREPLNKPQPVAQEAN